MFIFVLPWKKIRDKNVDYTETLQVSLVWRIKIHLENLKAHVGNSQVDLGSLSVGCRMKTDAVHLQFAGDLQDLEV